MSIVEMQPKRPGGVAMHSVGSKMGTVKTNARNPLTTDSFRNSFARSSVRILVWFAIIIYIFLQPIHPSAARRAALGGFLRDATVLLPVQIPNRQSEYHEVCALHAEREVLQGKPL